MSNTSHKRIPAKELDAHRQNALTMQSLTDYTPRNPAFSLATVQQQVADLTTAEEAEVMAWRAFEIARERATSAGKALQKTMQGVKVEVVAQYGEDSPAVHAVGLKRKSERARPVRRKPPEE